MFFLIFTFLTHLFLAPLNAMEPAPLPEENHSESSHASTIFSINLDDSCSACTQQVADAIETLFCLSPRHEISDLELKRRKKMARTMRIVGVGPGGCGSLCCSGAAGFLNCGIPGLISALLCGVTTMAVGTVPGNLYLKAIEAEQCRRQRAILSNSPSSLIMSAD